MTRALVKIRSEHSEMSLVLHCLERVAEAINRGSWPTDFKLLYHLIDWFEAFPATFHHPKGVCHLSCVSGMTGGLRAMTKLFWFPPVC